MEISAPPPPPPPPLLPFSQSDLIQINDYSSSSLPSSPWTSVLSLSFDIIQECIIPRLSMASLGACLLTCTKLRNCVKAKRPLPPVGERPSSRTCHKAALEALVEEDQKLFSWFVQTFKWPVLVPSKNRWGHEQTLHAAERGNLQVLQVLGTVFRIDKEVISAAAARGHISILQYYKSQWPAVPPSREDKDKTRFFLDWYQADDTVWYAAARNGHIDVLKWVSENVGFNRTCQRWPPRKRSVGNHGQDGLLVQGARSGRKDLVQWLLDQGLEDEDRMFASAGAAKGGHLDLLKWLVTEKGFVLGPTAFYYAVKHQHEDVIEWIIQNISEEDDVFEYSDAWEGGVCEAAAKAGRLDLLKRIHELFPNTYGELHWGRIVKGAIRSGNRELINWLIDQPSCSPDISAPMRAARLGDLELLKVLVDEKQFEMDFETVARQAANGGHAHVLQWLNNRKNDFDPHDPQQRELLCHGRPRRIAYPSILLAAARGGHALLSWLFEQEGYEEIWKSDEDSIQSEALECVLELGHAPKKKYHDKDEALLFLLCRKDIKHRYVLELLKTQRELFITKLLINNGLLQLRPAV